MYVKHYHDEHNHHGLGSQLTDSDSYTGSIECRKRFGGMLKHYHRPD